MSHVISSPQTVEKLGQLGASMLYFLQKERAIGDQVLLYDGEQTAQYIEMSEKFKNSLERIKSAIEELQRDLSH